MGAKPNAITRYDAIGILGVKPANSPERVHDSPFPIYKDQIWEGGRKNLSNKNI